MQKRVAAGHESGDWHASAGAVDVMCRMFLFTHNGLPRRRMVPSCGGRQVGHRSPDDAGGDEVSDLEGAGFPGGQLDRELFLAIGWAQDDMAGRACPRHLVHSRVG